MKLTIDNIEFESDEELTIYQAAQKVGVDIPVMCYKEGYDYFTSCMMCVVKDKKTGRQHPACSQQALDGMEIDTNCEEIREARKMTLELLLSDHIGDCEAPCQRVCPVHMEVPKMIREIMDDQMEDAIATVRLDLPIPSMLERHCNAPCETGCRRSKHDEGLAIRELARHAGDWDLKRGNPHIPAVKESTGRKIAIVGGGPTGLASAHYLAQLGHACSVYEKTDRIGGRIATEFEKAPLPDWIHDGELKVLRGMGIEIHLNAEVGKDKALSELQEDSDIVLLTCGATEPEVLQAMGMPVTEKGMKVNMKTGATEVENVFAGGSIVKPKQPLIKSFTTAKNLSACIDEKLNNQPMVGVVEKYNHKMGRLIDGELEIFVSGANPIGRLHPEDIVENGFRHEDAQKEGERCMHCDCRKKDNCKLRDYSDEYGARQAAFNGEERATHEHVNQNAGAVYEPGKCIKCGLCVRVTEAEGEDFGFTFVGRGFDLKTGVSLNKRLDEGLVKVAEQVVEACPTGALATNEKLMPEFLGYLPPGLKKLPAKTEGESPEPEPASASESSEG